MGSTAAISRKDGMKIFSYSCRQVIGSFANTAEQREIENKDSWIWF